MLGWVIFCYDDWVQEMFEGFEKKYGLLVQCWVVNFWCGLSVNMFSCMMCDVFYVIDFGEGVIFLIDIFGVVFYCVVLLMSYKYF